MEVDSARINVTKISQVLRLFHEINSSPLKSTISVVIVGVVLSGLLFAIFIIKQNLTTEALFKESKKTHVQDQVAKLKQKNDSTSQNQKLQDDQRKRDLSSLKNQVEMFYRDKEYYPPSLFNLVPQYTSQFPKDPVTGNEYFYQVGLDQKSYFLRAILSDNSEFELSNN